MLGDLCKQLGIGKSVDNINLSYSINTSAINFVANVVNLSLELSASSNKVLNSNLFRGNVSCKFELMSLAEEENEENRESESEDSESDNESDNESNELFL